MATTYIDTGAMSPSSTTCGNTTATTTATATTTEPSSRFRQSCDRCQGNKVRCNRDKPTCKRCAQKRLKCVYSPLRRIGRPKKSILSEEAQVSPGLDSNEGERDHGETRIESGITDVRMGDCDRGPLSRSTVAHHFDVSASPPTLFSTPNQSGGGGGEQTSRSVVDAWIADHPLSSNCSMNNLSDEGVYLSNTPGSDGSQRAQQEGIGIDCYTAALARTARLEQDLAQTTSPPPIDLILEAERDFSALRQRLLTCTGHKLITPNNVSLTPAIAPDVVESSPVLNNAIGRSNPCLASDRPVLLGLSLLAERVVGMLEDLFRLAAASSQTIDKANDTFWTGMAGVSDIGARRLQRSLRNHLTKPCVSLEMEARRDLRVGDFVVQGQAKSAAMGRILKLRTRRMLDALESLESDSSGMKDPGSERMRQQQWPSGGPLDWGGSNTVFGHMTDALLVDLRRRIESVQGAMVLL